MPYVPEEAITRFQRNPAISPKDLEGILNAYGQPASARTARRYLLYLKQGEADPRLTSDDLDILDEDEIASTEDTDGLTVASKSSTITGPDALLEAAHIDLDLWKLDKSTISISKGHRKNQRKDLTFEDGKVSGYIRDDGAFSLVDIYSVKVWLTRRVEKPFEDVLDSLVDKLNRPRKVEPILPKYPQGEYLLVPSLSDMHFGRLSVDGTYTPQQARDDLDKTGDALIARSVSMGMNISKIMIPVGNDLLNTDNLLGTTTKGTWQENSADIRDTINEVCESMIDFVEKCLLVAPVDVVMVPGNHDAFAVFWLGKVLDAWFTQHPYATYVTVNNSKDARKYYQFGTNLIGMEHGDRVKPGNLALLMATEAKPMWATSQFQVFLRGHFHKEKEMFTALTNEGGVQVITFPAFCPQNTWEQVMGYIGTNRAAEARFFHREHGPAGVFPIFVDELV